MTDEELKRALTDCLRSQLRTRRGIFLAMTLLFLAGAVVMPFIPAKADEQNAKIRMIVFCALFAAAGAGLWLHVSALATQALSLVFERPQDIASSRVIDYRINGVHFAWAVELKDVRGKATGFTVPTEEMAHETLARVTRLSADTTHNTAA